MFKRRLKKQANMKSVDLDILSKRTPFWKPLFLLLPALVVIILFVILPFVSAAQDGFQYNEIGSHSHRVSDKVVGLDNFKVLFEDPAFKTSISNSFLYAALSIPLIMVIALIISSAISTLIRKRLRGFWQTIFFLPYVTSAIAIGLTFAYIFDYDNGVLNEALGIKKPWLIDTVGSSSLWSMLIYGVWKGLAFNILIFTTAMLGVDKKLYKAASIDGAGPIKQFFSITLPAIKRTTSFLFTMGLIGAIKVFPLALFQNRPQDALSHNGGTILLYVYSKIADEHNYELAGAASLVLVVISIGFTVFVKSTTKLIAKVSIKVGENRVQNKINNTKIIPKI